MTFQIQALPWTHLVSYSATDCTQTGSWKYKSNHIDAKSIRLSDSTTKIGFDRRRPMMHICFEVINTVMAHSVYETLCVKRARIL